MKTLLVEGKNHGNDFAFWVLKCTKYSLMIFSEYEISSPYKLGRIKYGMHTYQQLLFGKMKIICFCYTILILKLR